jgi:hypothetical protein
MAQSKITDSASPDFAQEHSEDIPTGVPTFFSAPPHGCRQTRNPRSAETGHTYSLEIKAHSGANEILPQGRIDRRTHQPPLPMLQGGKNEVGVSTISMCGKNG